jgi:TPR repeat protein
LLNSLRQIAKRGNPTATLLVGLGEIYGWDGPRPVPNLDFIKRSAASGEPLALFVLAYKLGAHKSTFAEALDLAKLATAAGVAEAASLAGFISIDLNLPTSETLAWFKKAAELGDPRGYYWIATKCATNENGAELDVREWLEKAVVAGDIRSMHALARICLADGVGRDIVRGVELLRKAAEAGFVYSTLELVDIYRFGLNGIPRNAELAAYWEEKIENATNSLHLFTDF